MAKKPKKPKPNVGTFLFGRVPIDKNAVSHTRARSQPTRDLRAARKTLTRLERQRDKYYPGSAEWKKCDKAIDIFKEQNGL